MLIFFLTYPNTPMICLTVILIYLTNTMSGENLFSVKEVYFLENNFWSDDQRQEKTDKGYLFEVIIAVKGDNSSRYGVEYDITNRHYLKSTTLSYVVLDEWMIKDIYHSKAEVKKCFLRFIYLFTDELIKDLKRFEIYEGNVRIYKTYKLLEKMSENSIKLKPDGIEIKMFHIKERFKGLAYIKLLKLDEYIFTISDSNLKEKLENIKYDVKFELYFFNNPFECLENLKIFVKEIRCFKLIEDNVLQCNLTDLHNISIDNTTTIQTSKFINQLYEKFIKKFGIFNDNGNVENKSIQTSEYLFKKCCNHLKIKLLDNNFLFLIGNKYTIDFYIDKFCKLIYESLELKHDIQNIENSEEVNFIVCKMINLLDCHLRCLQSNIIKDLCDSEYAINHFAIFLGQEIVILDDYIKVEKMVCDYYNMFVYIANLVRNIKGPCNSFAYFSPIYVDNYTCRIINGIEINIRNLNKFLLIKSFDVKGNVVELKKDTDYFADKYGEKYFFTTDILKKKNIYTFELLSSESVFKRFRVDDYLNM